MRFSSSSFSLTQRVWFHFLLSFVPTLQLAKKRKRRSNVLYPNPSREKLLPQRTKKQKRGGGVPEFWQADKSAKALDLGHRPPPPQERRVKEEGGKDRPVLSPLSVVCAAAPPRLYFTGTSESWRESFRDSPTCGFFSMAFFTKVSYC